MGLFDKLKGKKALIGVMRITPHQSFIGNLMVACLVQ